MTSRLPVQAVAAVTDSSGRLTESWYRALAALNLTSNSSIDVAVDAETAQAALSAAVAELEGKSRRINDTEAQIAELRAELQSLRTQLRNTAPGDVAARLSVVERRVVLPPVYAVGTLGAQNYDRVSITGGAATLNGLTVNTNAASPVSGGLAGILVQFVGADGVSPRLLMDAANGGFGANFRRANGTYAVPTAIASGNICGTVNWFGYNGTAYSSASRAGITGTATENWTATANGIKLVFGTTAQGAAISVNRVAIGNVSGGVEVLGAAGAEPTSGDMGQGSVNVALGYYVNGVLQPSWVAVPAHNTSNGTPGQQAYDGSYFYACTATNTWNRVAWTAGAW